MTDERHYFFVTINVIKLKVGSKGPSATQGKFFGPQTEAAVEYPQGRQVSKDNDGAGQRTLHVHARLFSQKLKYPIRLRNDPEWHAEKIYRLKLKQYKAGRLKVEYFERANNQIYMEGRDIPMVQTQPLNEEDHDDTFDNFTRKKFVELPTSRFYDETLELSFGVGQVLKTEPSEPVNYKDFAITK